MKKQKLSKELKELATLNDVAKIVLVTCNEDITEVKTEKNNLLDDIAIAELNKAELDNAFNKLNKEYKNFKLLTERKRNSKSQRETNPTTNGTSRTTRSH